MFSARALRPEIVVLGGEPEGADDAFQSKQKGEMIPQLGPNTISDGLRTSLGDLTWPFVRDQVDEIVTVSDEETVAAMRMVWERMKIVVETSSAVPLAAVIKKYSGDSKKLSSNRKNIGIIVSGGNVDLANLPWQCRSCPS